MITTITHSETKPFIAPGYGALDYPLPKIGSYQLPSLGKAPNGEVLDTAGQRQQLHELFKNKYVLLAFIYSNCKDVNGCPLTSHVFYQIKSAMKHDPELAENLTLISLSFDPAIDTPEVMLLYRNNFSYAGNKGEWQFVTTASEHMLNPILESYNQDIQRQLTQNGEYTSDYSHILRVFLIDTEKNIRNIYSVAFLHVDLLLNDVRTLFKENNTHKIAQTTTRKIVSNNASLSTPGDDKHGYETGRYKTHSRAVQWRSGKAANLINFYLQPPLGLPPVPVPPDNRLTQEKIQLGRKLFFDRRLSLNDTFSCAMCHIPDQGFTNNELAMAVGIEGRSVRRNTPTLYNSAYATLLFHDGREENLEQQVWGPLLAHNEMANPSVGAVLSKIRNIPDYHGLFEAVFDGRGPTMETVGKALASYQRILVSADSLFDRWYYAKKEKTFPVSARRGLKIFSGKAGCTSCHIIGTSFALFTDNKLHNTGIGYPDSMSIKPTKERVQLAPGIFVDVDQSIIDEVSETVPADIGRYEITQNPYDRWKYKTPSLRNIALTAPYMHNGSLSSLQDVVEFYDKGGIANELLDPLIKPLQLSQQEKVDLVNFMQTLTGSNVNTLVSDAFAAPVGDITKDDPNWVHGSSVDVKNVDVK